MARLIGQPCRPRDPARSFCPLVNWRTRLAGRPRAQAAPWRGAGPLAAAHLILLHAPTAPQIDRDPKHFGAVLAYLRDGRLVLPQDARERQELKIEARYYCLVEVRRLWGGGAPRQRAGLEIEARHYCVVEVRAWVQRVAPEVRAAVGPARVGRGTRAHFSKGETGLGSWPFQQTRI